MDKRTLLEAGSGALTIVLVHGICCHASDWQWHVDAFSKMHHVIAPTLRAHEDEATDPNDLTIEGLASDVAAILAEKNITDAILIGHSLGQRVVLETQAQAPDRVAGLVLVDGSNSVAGDLNAMLAAFDGIADIKSWVQGLFDQMFLPDSFAEEQAMYRDRIEGMSADQLRALYRHMIIWDGTHLSERLAAASDTPLLVLQATIRAEDASRRSLMPGEKGVFLDMLEASHPNCTIITYPGLSHFLTLDAPERIKDDIDRWIAKIDTNV